MRFPRTTRCLENVKTPLALLSQLLFDLSQTVLSQNVSIDMELREHKPVDTRAPFLPPSLQTEC